MKLVHFVVAFIIILTIYNTDYKVVTGEGFYTKESLDSLTQQVGFLSRNEDGNPIDINLINVEGDDTLSPQSNINVKYFYHVELHMLPKSLFDRFKVVSNK